MDMSLNNGTTLPVMESFYSIQGEGFYTGNPAYFLRVGGCDVGCYWCDVKESWDSNIHPLRKVDELVREALSFPANTMVVTGGEPLMWDMKYLTDNVKKNGIRTHLETSGSHKLTGSWDWICLSPKKFQNPIKTIKPLANELKIIIKNKSDFEWAENQREGINKHCKLYLQPEWSEKDKIIPLIIDYVMRFPLWGISLQTHKYLNLP